MDTCIVSASPSWTGSMASWPGSQLRASPRGALLDGFLDRLADVAIVGGLLVSQLLTMFTTPVVYLSLDRFSRQKRVPVRTSPAPL